MVKLLSGRIIAAKHAHMMESHDSPAETTKHFIIEMTEHVANQFLDHVNRINKLFGIKVYIVESKDPNYFKIYKEINND